MNSNNVEYGMEVDYHDVLIHKKMKEEAMKKKVESSNNDDMRHYIKIWHIERSALEDEIHQANKTNIDQRYNNLELKRENKKLRWDLRCLTAQYRHMLKKQDVKDEIRMKEREEIRKLREEMKKMSKENERLYDRLNGSQKTEHILSEEKRRKTKVKVIQSKEEIMENIDGLKDCTNNLKNAFVDFSKMIEIDFFDNFSGILGDLISQMNFVIEESEEEEEIYDDEELLE